MRTATESMNRRRFLASVGKTATIPAASGLLADCG